MFIVHYLSISVPFFFLVWGGGGESWIMLIRKIEYFGFEASAYGIKDWKQIIWFFSLNYYRTSFVYRIRLWWPFIYVYIYIYIYIYIYTPVYKNIAISKYISYICKNTEERLKQRGHTLHQPRGVTITYNICFWQKILKIQAQKRNNYIYDIQVLN